ncbi:MAG: hypothetical protein ACO3YN_04760, partial [Rubrivivax sp.]
GRAPAGVPLSRPALASTVITASGLQVRRLRARHPAATAAVATGADGHPQALSTDDWAWCEATAGMAADDGVSSRRLQGSDVSASLAKWARRFRTSGDPVSPG